MANQSAAHNHVELAPERLSDDRQAPDGRSRSVSGGSGTNGRNGLGEESESRSESDREENRPTTANATPASAQQQYQLRRLSQDEPYNPPPSQVQAQDQAQTQAQAQALPHQQFKHGPYRYDKEHYPAYDSNARRIGLDHVRYEHVPAPPENGTRPYYRPRTHTYPAHNTPMSELPHVMTMTLDIRRPARHGPNSASASGDVPQDIDMAPPTMGAFHSAVTPMYAPTPSRTYKFIPLTYTSQNPSLQQELDLGRTDRRVTTGRPTAQALVPRDTTDGTPHLREMLGLGPNDTVDLNSLSDPPPGAKPSYPYPVLIQLAINGSPRKRLTLSEIYSAIEERFEWFRTTEDKAWQVGTSLFSRHFLAHLTSDPRDLSDIRYLSNPASVRSRGPSQNLGRVTTG